MGSKLDWIVLMDIYFLTQYNDVFCGGGAWQFDDLPPDGGGHQQVDGGAGRAGEGVLEPGHSGQRLGQDALREQRQNRLPQRRSRKSQGRTDGETTFNSFLYTLL